MIRHAITAAFTILLGTTAFSQSRTTIGAELGISNDIYQILESNDLKDPGQAHQLKKFPIISTTKSILLRRQLGKTFFVEAGLMDKRYQQGIGFKFEQGYSTSGAFRSLMVPIRFGARINLLNEKLFVTPLAGLTYSRNYLPPFTGTGSGWGSSGSAPGATTNYEYNYATAFHTKSHWLLQTGLGLELRLPKNFSFHVNAGYYHGFKPVISQDIRYRVNGQSWQSAKTLSTGDMFTAGAGIRYSLDGLIKRK